MGRGRGRWAVGGSGGGDRESLRTRRSGAPHPRRKAKGFWGAVGFRSLVESSLPGPQAPLQRTSRSLHSLRQGEERSLSWGVRPHREVGGCRTGSLVESSLRAPQNPRCKGRPALCAPRGAACSRAGWSDQMAKGKKGETPAGERGFLVVPLAIPLAGLDCCRVDLNRRDDRHAATKLRIVDSRRNPQKYVDRFP